MVIDSSAVMAVLQLEPEADLFLEAIAADPIRLMSAVSALECSIVQQSRRVPGGVEEFRNFQVRAGIDVVPLDMEQVEIATAAFALYGKGRSRAALNMGDCCSYALAKQRKQPLLYKGRDFSETDIEPAV